MSEVLNLVLNWDTVRHYKHRQAVLVRCADLEVGLRKLPRPEREAVFWHGMAGMTQRDASKLLGVGETTIRRRYHRGMGWLLLLMNGCGG